MAPLSEAALHKTLRRKLLDFLCSEGVLDCAHIDDAGVIERILKHIKVWQPRTECRSPAGPDPPRIHAATTSAMLPACRYGTGTRMRRPFSASG
jgi:hypothetical protein